MSYTNLTTTIVKPCEAYVRDNWVQLKDTRSPVLNFVAKHLAARCAYAALVPLSLITNVFDTMIGILFGIVSIGTFGQIKRINEITLNHIERAPKIVTNMHKYFLRAINPGFTRDFSAKIAHEQHLGFVHQIVTEPISKTIKNSLASQNKVKKYVLSRLLVLSLLPVSVGARMVDGLIAVPLIPFSLITAGATERLASLHNLTTKVSHGPTGVIADLIVYLLVAINPWLA